MNIERKYLNLELILVIFKELNKKISINLEYL
jgi:hypothetical protein